MDLNLVKQPNGKYCDMGWLGEPNFINYNEEDIINLYIEQAKKDIENAKYYGYIIEILCEERNKDKSTVWLKDIGFEQPFNELAKYIPRKPINQQYISCNFTTVGICPNCGNKVYSGMGHTDKKCECGQLLKWS